MKSLRLHLFLTLAVMAAFGEASFAQEKANRISEEFQTFLAKIDAAQVELQNGKSEPYKAVWSHTDDVTLSGGFGGMVEKGWSAVGKRLDWVAARFSKGKNAIDRLVTSQNGDLGYVVQLEHIQFTVPETGKPATRDYRVTMIFRREKDGWRIVHRHADSQMTKQEPR